MNMHHPSGAQEAIAFLKLIDPTGRHHLDAFHPETGATEGWTFEPGAWDEIADWIRPRIGQRNLYFSVNEPKPGAPHKKLTKADIAAIRCVFVDADPRGDRETARHELAQRAEEVDNGPLPATVSIDSGNGQQWFWKLEEKIGALTGGQWAEDQSRTLGRLFKGDAVQNIDRIMRLPGTVNLPTPKKLAKGLMGGMVRVTHSRGVTYTPERLAAYCAPTGPLERKEADAAVRAAMDDIDVDEAHSYGDFDALPDTLKARLVTAGARDGRLRGILDGTIDPPDDGSGSAWRAVLAAALARHGFSAQDYANVVCAWPLGYPQHSGLDGLTLRVLSRDWGRCGAPASQDTTAERWFDGGAAPSSAEGGGLLFGLDDGTPPAPAEPPLRAGRVTLDDLMDLPPREWLYGFKLSRRYVTFLASPGGVGKTAFTIAMALACAAGAGLLHDTPRKPLRVWLYNLEDDIVELRRRLAAAIRHFGLDPSVLDNIRLNSGRDRRFKIVKQDREGGFIVTPDYAAVIAEMQREGIDILVVDPFLRSHGVSENENEAQDEVMRLYAQIAEETNAGIVLVHHTKKGAIAGDMDSLRGGSTQGGGARAAFTLSPMTVEDAERLGVPEDKRRLYVRLDDAKNNMAPPASRAEWLHLASVGLNNGTPEYPAGDHVQVATAWEPPKAWEGVEGASEADALRLIDEGLPDGERYSARPQDTDRYAGTALVERFGCTEGHAKATLANWTKQGLIELREYRSPTQRKDRKGLYVTRLGTLSGGSIFD